MDDQGLGVRFAAVAESFHFPVAIKSAKRPTRPPINWIPGVLSLGLREKDVELTTHFHVMPDLKKAGNVCIT
jgi:hypothetical protein